MREQGGAVLLSSVNIHQSIAVWPSDQARRVSATLRIGGGVLVARILPSFGDGHPPLSNVDKHHQVEPILGLFIPICVASRRFQPKRVAAIRDHHGHARE